MKNGPSHTSGNFYKLRPCACVQGIVTLVAHEGSRANLVHVTPHTRGKNTPFELFSFDYFV
jgi:hypothetical protein